MTPIKFLAPVIQKDGSIKHTTFPTWESAVEACRVLEEDFAKRCAALSANAPIGRLFLEGDELQYATISEKDFYKTGRNDES